MWWNQVLALLLLPTSGLLLVRALAKSKTAQFYSDTPYAWPLGIYVWGDALILAPFWGIMAGAFWFIGPLMTFRWLCLFYTVRSAYEVIYWLNHQFSGKKYQAPLLRRVSWISTDDSAVLYQLMNMCFMIAGLGLLLISYG